MASSLSVPAATPSGLTPNSRTEAEIALAYNAFRQTASAAKPQITTPTTEEMPPRPVFKTRTSSNYQSAAALANLSHEPPYPTEATAEAIRVNLSRGTTQAVLEKMASGDPSETLLNKRLSRDEARRASQPSVDGESAARPVLYTRQSYNQEDMKRLMSQKLMEDEPKGPDAAGYDSIK